MVDLDSQYVRGLLSDLLTRFLTPTWSIWTLSLCVVCCRNLLTQADPHMVYLDSQSVRGLLSNVLTWFLTPTWSIWTLSLCVVYSRTCSLDF